ncbi:hypothetical protein N7444_000082 [Penicillium canescens]|nr:hypothetical protein N7444_000082 [Penicillium canescens]KAJ6175163.1 hypothetical protein N7485_004968 [Penicillium canescens]
MGCPNLPFEIIMIVSTYLNKGTPNSIVQTSRTVARALTPRLCDLALSPDNLLTTRYATVDWIKPLRTIPAAVFNHRVWSCAAKWKPDPIIHYMLTRFKYDSLCLRLLSEDTLDRLIARYYPLLHLVAATGNLAITRALIDAGAPVEARFEGLGTPLQIAWSQGHEHIAEYLLDCGTGILVSDSRGQSAVMSASGRG